VIGDENLPTICGVATGIGGLRGQLLGGWANTPDISGVPILVAPTEKAKVHILARPTRPLLASIAGIFQIQSFSDALTLRFSANWSDPE